MNDDGQELAIEVDLEGPFTLDEIVAIEEIAGTGETVGPRSGRFMRAAALVVGRRTAPDLTLADVGGITVGFRSAGDG